MVQKIWSNSKSQQKLEPLCISWTQQVVNVEVLIWAGIKTTLQYDTKTIQKHKLKLFGHVIRQKGIQWEILEGMTEGKETEEDREPHEQTTAKCGWGTRSMKIW